LRVPRLLKMVRKKKLPSLNTNQKRIISAKKDIGKDIASLRLLRLVDLLLNED